MSRRPEARLPQRTGRWTCVMKSILATCLPKLLLQAPQKRHALPPFRSVQCLRGFSADLYDGQFACAGSMGMPWCMPCTLRMGKPCRIRITGCARHASLLSALRAALWVHGCDTVPPCNMNAPALYLPRACLPAHRTKNNSTYLRALSAIITRIRHVRA